MFSWPWGSLREADFKEEKTEFDGYRIYRSHRTFDYGPLMGCDRTVQYPTQKARESHRSNSRVLATLLVADMCLFAGGFTLAGVAVTALWGVVAWSSERHMQKLARREAEIQSGLDRSLTSSVWQVEPEHDFAMRVRDITPGYDPEGSRLLKAWLADCDEHHDCSHRKPSFTPLRLIDTKPDGRSTNCLVLVEHLQYPDYVVLSHCWGKLTGEEEARFCTNSDNIEQRLEGFDLAGLPQSFQDAVTVTRAIGRRYLWIDSVCFIQPRKAARNTGGDARSRKDMAAGLKLMDQVFASAYCTIAASSATDSKQGFLSGHEVTNVPGFSANFERDVNQSPLNQRAWVLQERVLSRRTIHFTSRHVYWKCGEFARCDNFTKLTSAPGKDFFVQDPHFPERLSSAGTPRIVRFLEWFIHGYSKRGITVAHDRYNAISGLITRMKSNDVFGDHGEYGVFDFCLARLLLWRRADGSSRPPIDYTAIDAKSVPSWSWMAYPGEVEFIVGASEKFNVAVGNDLRMEEGGRRLQVHARSMADCRAFARLGGWVKLRESKSGNYIGELWADQKVDARIESCVVVGYDKEKALSSNPMVYVIFVQKARAGGKLTRLGVGKVKAKYIYRSGTHQVLE